MHWRIILALTFFSGSALCGAAELRDPVEVEVPANQAWTATGVTLVPGQAFHISAQGQASMLGARLWDWFLGKDFERRVGPEGTYMWPRDYLDLEDGQANRFPLPSLHEGPGPAFSLIGKIGENGDPFYVGKDYYGGAPQAGELWLGVNDDHPANNTGHFTARISQVDQIPEPPPRKVLDSQDFKGQPIEDARAILLYIDGLRPDVMHEMAQQGLLPNLKELFIDKGTEFSNSFTVFPSNTLISNGALFTGMFPDKNGIKSQNQFERAMLKPIGMMDEWMPNWWMLRFGEKIKVINLLDKYAPENTHSFIRKYEVPTLGSRLGRAFRYTTLPIMPINPPVRWLHRAINTIGPFGISVRVPRKLDVINAQYAVEEIMGDVDARIITVWLPMVDKTCHFSPYGQFGAARRDLALADLYIGRILNRLSEVGWEDNTYFFLISDHGHIGGDIGINSVANLPRDWGFRVLGGNSKVVGDAWIQPGIDDSRFLFFDNQGAGQAKIYLPFGDFFRGPWKRNRLYELMNYRMRPGQPTVNLIESLEAFRPSDAARTSRPIDLILVKLSDDKILIRRNAGCQAFVMKSIGESGEELFQYQPVRDVVQKAGGDLMFETNGNCDPLGYLQDESFIRRTGGHVWIGRPRPADEWLEATMATDYPDAVVTMFKFFDWSKAHEALAELRDPDILVTASRGWSLRSDGYQGTDHGYPLAESARIAFFAHGPNIPVGVREDPKRIIDVMPTLLEAVGWPYDPKEMDGRAVEGLYR